MSLKRRGTKGANILLVYNVTISLQYASNEVLQGEREGSTWSGSSSEFERFEVCPNFLNVVMCLSRISLLLYT